MRPATRSSLAIAGATAALVIAGPFMPAWLSFLIVAILSKSLVVVGVVVLMRTGIVSFGQGLYFCVGGYAFGLGGHLLGISDAFVLMALAAVSGLIIGGVFGLLMSRFRDIFFAMFSMALSMILYGMLSQNQALGSTDGFNVVAPTFLGYAPGAVEAKRIIFVMACLISGGVAWLGSRYLRSPMGFAGEAVMHNEVRVEYLGVSPRQVVYVNYLIASVTAALGGGLMALALGHVGPEMTFWTQSGEFIFIALLGGTGNIAAPFLGTALFEFVRTYAIEFAPDAWQMILGIVLLVVIIFLPNGLWSLVARRQRREA